MFYKNSFLELFPASDLKIFPKKISYIFFLSNLLWKSFLNFLKNVLKKLF